jgi:large repetitive protein
VNGSDIIDADNDGINNNVDLDSDNDGIPDTIENGFTDVDQDGVIDVFVDNNNDGQNDGSANNINSDDDKDGVVNIFDIDSDDDGITDIKEVGGSDPDNNGLIGTGTTISDIDKDGLSDIVDPKNGSGSGTGTPLVIVNSDSDVKPNFLDIDADNDGIIDIIEGQTTNDYKTPTGLDTDKDGLDNAFDNFNGLGGSGTNPVNTDGTDKPDYTDTDTDNDGILDLLENGTNNNNPDNLDADKDGLLNVFDVVTTGQAIGFANETNGNQTPSSFPNTQNSATSERDWREDSSGEIEVPTGFTPSADGMVIKGLSSSAEPEIVIFNRWGNVVYKTSDYITNPWKGQNEGDLSILKTNVNAQNTSGEIVPEGTYFYILTYKNSGGEKKNKQGYVYIKY